jgi:hypothetical protein
MKLKIYQKLALILMFSFITALFTQWGVNLSVFSWLVFVCLLSLYIFRGGKSLREMPAYAFFCWGLLTVIPFDIVFVSGDSIGLGFSRVYANPHQHVRAVEVDGRVIVRCNPLDAPKLAVVVRY